MSTLRIGKRNTEASVTSDESTSDLYTSLRSQFKRPVVLTANRSQLNFCHVSPRRAITLFERFTVSSDDCYNRYFVMSYSTSVFTVKPIPVKLLSADAFAKKLR